MKRKIIYSLLAASLLLPMGFNGCTKEAVMEEACIVTSLSNVKTRGEALFADEDIIEKVRIFVFVSNGGVEKNLFYVKDTDEFKNPFSICGIAQGEKEIYIVANESPDLNLDAITNKSELLKKLATPTITGPLDGAPLLMTGETSVNLTADDAITIPLTRVAAKISLKFKKGTDKEVTITKVSLLSNTGKSTLFEGGTPIAEQTYWDLPIELGSPLGLNTDPVPIPNYDAIYVYENLTGGDKTNATQLEIEAIYDGIPTVYRVYINEQVNVPADPGYTPTPAGDPYTSEVNLEVPNPDHIYYQIKRNHHYVFLGTIVNLGEYTMLEVKVKILPWTVHQYQVPLE